ncbi:MAG: PQQ-binding-like beta-propeller repeat protein [Planctomycetota bacterium]
MSFAVAMGFVSLHVAALTADEPLRRATDDPERTKALLSDLLIRNRDTELLLAAALKAGEPITEQSFESLSRIFEEDLGTLQYDSRTGSSINVRQEALRLLKSAGSSTLKSWSRAREPFASAELKQAGTLEELIRVEHRYPLTSSGLRGGLSATALLQIRGCHHLANLRLQSLEQIVAGTHLEEELTRSADGLRRALEKSNRPENPDGSARSVRGQVVASLANRSELSTIAPVWPRKSWSWLESIDDYPHAPQPVTWETLSPFVRESFYSLDEFNNWRPILTGNCVVHRTPLRIVALDAQSGREVWSVPTDTVAYPRAEWPEQDDAPRRFMSVRQKEVTSGIESIRDLQAYGMMSADAEQLYFLDGFTLVDATDDATVIDQEMTFRRLEFTRREYPNRLVAMRFRDGDVPEVAWIVGASEKQDSHAAFTYRGVRDLDELKSMAPPAGRRGVHHPALPGPEDSNVVGNHRELSLDGHAFLSPPCGAADQLFLITEYARQTYVTSLLRQTGRILWQRPVANFGLRSLPTESSLCVRGNCLLCDGVLCCVFHDGVVAGLRPVDGELLWATACREANQEQGGQRLGWDFSASDVVREGAAIVPVANSSVMVVFHPVSDHIFAIDARTGGVRWVVSRATFGLPAVDGERDVYIAGITESQVILLGEHHCRALDVTSGEQQWTVDMGESSGRAEVSADRCLIPQKNGQLLTIELATGRLHRLRHRFLPDAPDEPWGALLCSDTHIYVSTPVSMTSFLRCDAILQDEELFRSIDEKPPVLTRARLLLINHSDDEAIRVLREAAGTPSDVSSATAEAGDAAIQAELHRTLAEVILQRWADHYVAASEESRQNVEVMGQSDAAAGLDDAGSARVRLQEYGRSAEVLQLGDLKLDSDQQLRAAILALLSQSGFTPDAADLADLESFPEWSRIQPMTDDWSVRPDLLLSPLMADVQGSWNQTSVSVSNCRRIALKMLQFPGLMSDASRTEAVTQQLISLGDFALAESMLLVWKRSDSTGLADSLLRKVRQTEENPAEDRFPRGFVSSRVSGRRLTVDVINTMDISPAAMSLNTLNQSSLKAAQQLPAWLPYHVAISTTGDARKQLNIAERQTGTIVAMIIPGGQVDDLVPAYPANVADEDQPALLPVLCGDSIEMLNLTRPERSRILWATKPGEVGSHRSLNAYFEFGPVMPDCMIWYSGGSLRCTQSVTGEDLWSRRMSLKGSQAFARGLRRIFGDHRAVVVLSEDHSKLERFRTRDGQSLGTGVLRLRANSDALPVGRFLVYSDANGQITVLDGETGQHRVVEVAAGTSPVITLRHTFHRISGHRVVTVDSDRNLVVFDIATAKVQCRIPLQSHLRNDQIFDLVVFEQHGRLFVGVEDEVNMYRNAANDPENLPTIQFGVLFHVDPVAGVIKWSRRTDFQSFVVPAGDPTDVLVAIRDTSWTSAEDEMKRSTIRITLIDGTSGKELADETVSSRRPYRIAHFATESLLELTAAETVTRIQLAPAETQSDDADPEQHVPNPDALDDGDSSTPKTEAPQ